MKKIVVSVLGLAAMVWLTLAPVQALASGDCCQGQSCCGHACCHKHVK